MRRGKLASHLQTNSQCFASYDRPFSDGHYSFLGRDAVYAPNAEFSEHPSKSEPARTPPWLSAKGLALALLLSVVPLAGSLAQAQELNSKQLAAGSVAGQERENLGKRKPRGHLKIMTAAGFERAPSQQKWTLLNLLKSNGGGSQRVPAGTSIGEIEAMCKDWLVYWEQDADGNPVPGTAVVHCDGEDTPLG